MRFRVCCSQTSRANIHFSNSSHQMYPCKSSLATGLPEIIFPPLRHSVGIDSHWNYKGLVTYEGVRQSICRLESRSPFQTCRHSCCGSVTKISPNSSVFVFPDIHSIKNQQSKLALLKLLRTMEELTENRFWRIKKLRSLWHCMSQLLKGDQALQSHKRKHCPSPHEYSSSLHSRKSHWALGEV